MCFSIKSKDFLKRPHVLIKASVHFLSDSVDGAADPIQRVSSVNKGSNHRVSGALFSGLAPEQGCLSTEREALYCVGVNHWSSSATFGFLPLLEIPFVHLTHLKTRKLAFVFICLCFNCTVINQKFKFNKKFMYRMCLI